MKIKLTLLIIFFCQNIESSDSALASTSQVPERRSFEIGNKEIEKLYDLISIRVAKKELKRGHRQTNDALKIVSAAALGVCGATVYNNFYRNAAKQVTKSLNSDRASIFIVAISAIAALATIIFQYINNKRYSRIEEALKKQSAELEKIDLTTEATCSQTHEAVLASDSTRTQGWLNEETLQQIKARLESIASDAQTVTIALTSSSSEKAEASDRVIGMTIPQFNNIVRQILTAREKSVVVQVGTHIIESIVRSGELSIYTSQMLLDYALKRRPDIGKPTREFIDKKLEEYAIRQMLSILVSSDNENLIRLLNEYLQEMGARFRIVAR